MTDINPVSSEAIAAKADLNLHNGKEAAKLARKVRTQRIRALIADLKKLFPHTFKEPCVPLKCKIFDDIMVGWPADGEHAVPSKKLLRDTLQFYTHSLVYHQACLQEHAMRIDLTGIVIEPVSDQAKVHHQRCMNNITALHEKRAAKKVKRELQNKNAVPANGKTTLGTKMPAAAITTDAEGRIVLSLKQESNEK